MSASPLISQLMDALRCLPGVGNKTAQRMAFHLLERDRDGGRQLSRVLARAMDEVGHCSDCRTLCETELCALCASGSRDPELLCVVETPVDVDAIEQATNFRGRYFVLMGHLSPLDGIGPEQLGLGQLDERTSANWPVHRAFAPPVSRTVYRWVASWNTSTVARLRMPFPDAVTFSVIAHFK